MDQHIVEGTVIHRSGQFFVVEGQLRDGSVLFDVCANSDRGDQVITLALTRDRIGAVDCVDRLAKAREI